MDKLAGNVQYRLNELVYNALDGIEDVLKKCYTQEDNNIDPNDELGFKL